MTNETLLQSMIDKSLTEWQHSQARKNEDHWFSRPNQNKLVFEHAQMLLMNWDITTEEAIRQAQAFVNTYYEMIIKPTTSNYRG